SLLYYLVGSSTHPASTEIYTLSLHDALPIFRIARVGAEELTHQILEVLPEAHASRILGLLECLVDHGHRAHSALALCNGGARLGDRKSTRLNSSHGSISYAVFCLKKKTKQE